MRRIGLCLALVGCVAAALIPAAARAQQTNTVVVGTDPPGDWGPLPGDAGEILGQDLTGAALAVIDSSTINFTLEVTSLPPFDVTSGAWSAYVWDFTVDGKWFRVTNWLCDPSSLNLSSCLPHYTVGTDPFNLQLARMRFELLRCGDDRLVVLIEDCVPIASPLATMDPDTATITIPVPRDLIGARPGSVIAPNEDLDWGIFASLLPDPAAPGDELVYETSYTVPSGPGT